MGQGRRHDQVFPGDVQIQHPHQLQVLHVLLGDPGDGDIEDVVLVLFDQVQEEVQGPLEDIDLDGVSVDAEGMFCISLHG